jgi:hypothetical protein
VGEALDSILKARCSRPAMLQYPCPLSKTNKTIQDLTKPIRHGSEFASQLSHYPSRWYVPTPRPLEALVNSPRDKDLGYSDIGCFGSEIRTPNIDTLASNGARFTDCMYLPVFLRVPRTNCLRRRPHCQRLQPNESYAPKWYG